MVVNNIQKTILLFMLFMHDLNMVFVQLQLKAVNLSATAMKVEKFINEVCVETLLERERERERELVS